MARSLDTEGVRRLVGEGAQLVEVLPAAEYRTEHLPGAVHLPLTELTPQAAARLDPTRPVVVYCYDAQCDLSARGAALLECYGFPAVYDYTTSKAAWLAMGLPGEGEVAMSVRAGAFTSPAVTCAPSAELADLDEAGPGGVVVVVDDAGVVLGTVAPPALGRTGRAIDVASTGPPTVRPSITADELARSMDADGRDHVLVTTLDGRLLGVVEREALDVDR